MWILTGDYIATKPKHGIPTKKFMFTVMWNPLGFHIVERLPTGAEMNSDDFTPNIIA
jgi:hypothetical protein